MSLLTCLFPQSGLYQAYPRSPYIKSKKSNVATVKYNCLSRSYIIGISRVACVSQK